MAFLTIIPSRFAVGKAWVKNLITDIVNDLNDLNTRQSSTEAIANKVELYNDQVLGAGNFTSFDAEPKRVTAGIDIIDIKVIVDDISGISSGILEIDILKSATRDFSSAVSVQTTNASIDFSTASSFDESTNSVLDPSEKVLEEGDWVLFRLISKPAALGRFNIYVIGEAS